MQNIHDKLRALLARWTNDAVPEVGVSATAMMLQCEIDELQEAAAEAVENGHAA